MDYQLNDTVYSTDQITHIPIGTKGVITALNNGNMPEDRPCRVTFLVDPGTDNESEYTRWCKVDDFEYQSKAAEVCFWESRTGNIEVKGLSLQQITDLKEIIHMHGGHSEAVGQTLDYLNWLADRVEAYMLHPDTKPFILSWQGQPASYEGEKQLVVKGYTGTFTQKIGQYRSEDGRRIIMVAVAEDFEQRMYNDLLDDDSELYPIGRKVKFLAVSMMSNVPGVIVKRGDTGKIVDVNSNSETPYTVQWENVVGPVMSDCSHDLIVSV